VQWQGALRGGFERSGAGRPKRPPSSLLRRYDRLKNRRIIVAFVGLVHPPVNRPFAPSGRRRQWAPTRERKPRFFAKHDAPRTPRRQNGRLAITLLAAHVSQLSEEGMITMQSRIAKIAQIVTMTGFAAALSLPAAAETHHWRARHHQQALDRPLTITKRHAREAIVARPDPFHGPAAIVTAPNAVAATIVSLPFRAAAVVFPPYGDPARNPLILIGAPVHAAGYVAEFPFFVVGSAFGAAPNVY
jgi:hypothetical protein